MVVHRPAILIAALAAMALPARAVVARAEKDARSASEAELTRCRQVIREWALRDARTTVDEQGRSLR